MFIRKLIPLSALLVTLTAGCSLAPSYHRPDAPTPDAWPGSMTISAASISAADLGWRQFFTDQPLQNLITTALQNNRDLRVTALNIQRARAMYAIQRADLLPTVNGTGGSTTQRLPADLSTTRQPGITRQYNAGVGMSNFELDFFGRVQSLNESALNSYLATEEAHLSSRISLVAEVASAYLTLVADRERLTIAEETLQSQRASYEMIKRRYETGVSSELDLRQAQTSVDTARVDIARYTGQVAVDSNVLAVLVGVGLNDEMLPGRTLDQIKPMLELPVSLPSDVLLRRPDILQAEYVLKAANADIGAARANFFPRITLTASAGTVSTDFNNVFKGGTGTWSFMPSLVLPIFDTGRNIAQLRVSEADRDIAVANYEKAIQVAFREAADALIQRDTLRQQFEAQTSLLEAATETYKLSDARYQKGVDSYLGVLDSQRFMYTAQLNHVAVRALRDSNLIQLYKALGGGWTENSVKQ